MAQAEAEPLLTHPGAGLARIAVGPLELVIEAWNPVPRLLIVGASDLALALTRQVELLGWTASTTVQADAALVAVAELSPADVVVVIDHDPFVATPVLGARTPAETAVSILAEVIAVRAGRLGTPLGTGTGRISG